MCKRNDINYVKEVSAILLKYPSAQVPASSTALKLVKVCSTESFLDKKYTGQKSLLMEEIIHETRSRLQHSPYKFLA
jgi:hypothetical protein